MERGEKLIFKDRAYKYNQTFLKSYGKGKYKLVTVACSRNSGVDVDDWGNFSAKGTVNEDKLKNNLSRSRSKIFEYAFCNEWNWFCTFTVDDKKYNRYDLENYHKALAQTIRNTKRKSGVDIKYLIVPETHINGAWHEHGLLSDLPKSELYEFTLCDNIPEKLKERIRQGERLYSWTTYQSKFGYCILEPIRSDEGVARYITKYITKDLERNVSEINAHTFYSSNGLKSATTIKKGSMSANIEPDFIGEFSSVKWFDNVSDERELLKLFD